MSLNNPNFLVKKPYSIKYENNKQKTTKTYMFKMLFLLIVLDRFLDQTVQFIWVTGTSPIRLLPIGRSPLAKIRRYIGETPPDFRQLSKFYRTCWQKYSGLSPVAMNQL